MGLAINMLTAIVLHTLMTIANCFRVLISNLYVNPYASQECL